MDYSKKRRGRKIAIVADTRPTNETIQAAKEADLLVHEATFLEKQKDKAIEALHTTAQEAATIAKKAKAKKLAQYHFSARNTSEEEILQEAKKIFENTTVPKEMETIIV